MPSNADDLFIGIDVGTSKCRASIVDVDGRETAFAVVPLPPPERNGDRVSQHAHVWWDAVAAVLDDVLRLVPRAHIAAITVAGTSGTLLLSNALGDPLAPALMYNDQSSHDEALLVRNVAPADTAAQGASSALSRLLQLLKTVPAQSNALAMLQADWIAGRLRGAYGISDENNALKLGYDAVERAWPHWIDRLLVSRDILPRVVPAGTATGTVSPEIAERFDLPRDTVVVAGTTDSVAAAFAAGIDDVGDAVTSLGSTMVLKVVTTKSVTDSAYGVYTHRFGERWLAGGASNTGGAVLASYFSDGELDRLSQAIDPDRESPLDYYPLLAAGERFPTNDPTLQPRMSPRPESDVAFLHGLLESMARIERDGYHVLASLGAAFPTCVRTAGGGARSESWRRIRERVLGVPVKRAVSGEASYGAALLAKRATA